MVKINNNVLNLVLDTRATASLIKEIKCNDLNIPMVTTVHKTVQVDGAKLNVVGEIHTTAYRYKNKSLVH